MKKEMSFTAKQNYFRSAILLIIIMLYSDCIAAEVDTSRAFKIGAVTVSRYELFKNLLPIIENYKAAHKTPPPEDSIDTWRADFINRYYLAADAYSKGYYEDTLIDKMVNDMAYYMLTKKRGLVNEKLIEDEIKLNEQEMPEMYEKRKSKYYFDFIRFKNMQRYKETARNLPSINTPDKFTELIQIAGSFPDILMQTVDGFPWPFGLVWDICNQIYEMKPGEVSAPIEAKSGVYIIHLKNTEAVEPESYNQFRKEFPEYYRFTKGMWLINNNESRILDSANIQINNENFRALYESLKKFGSPDNMPPDVLNSLMEKPLFAYEIDTNRAIKTVSGFLKGTGRNIFNTKIENEKILSDYINQMVIEDYLIHKSYQLGLTKESKFILDRKNYKNNLVLIKYKQEELDTEPVSEKDVLHEYEIRRESLREPTGSLYQVFEFDNFENANTALGILQSITRESESLKPLSSPDFPGLVNPSVIDTVDCLPCALQEESGRSVQTALSEIVGPVKLGQSFKIFYMIKEPEYYYKPIGEVRKQLYHIIENRRQTKAMEEILPELKKKYQLNMFDVDIQ